MRPGHQLDGSALDAITIMLAVFLDIETTGLDPKVHCPVAIAFKIVDLSSGKTLATFQKEIAISQVEWQRRDPESIAINGYTWQEVQQGEVLQSVQKEMVALFAQHGIVRGQAVYICQNPSFDRMFLTYIIPVTQQEELQWPYHWLDLASMYWALTAVGGDTKPQLLSKNAIAKVYGLPPEKYPHRAINGVDHLIACYQALFALHH